MIITFLDRKTLSKDIGVIITNKVIINKDFLQYK